MTMIPMDTFLTFGSAALVLSIVPGPDNLFVLSQSAIRGTSTGMVVTLGLCTGLIVHTTAVALGVAGIFQTSQFAFTSLKLIGAAYLLYLAYQAFRMTAGTAGDGGVKAAPLRHMYRRAILMNVTNPKVAVFFLAFLPQFTSPARGNIAAQMFALGAIFILCTLVSFSAISLASGQISRWLTRSENSPLILNRIAGTVFVLLAINLAVAHL